MSTARARTTRVVASPHGLAEWARRSDHAWLRARLRSDSGVDVA